jgi:hypothetical protein
VGSANGTPPTLQARGDKSLHSGTPRTQTPVVTVPRPRSAGQPEQSVGKGRGVEARGLQGSDGRVAPRAGRTGRRVDGHVDLNGGDDAGVQVKPETIRGV